MGSASDTYLYLSISEKAIPDVFIKYEMTSDKCWPKVHDDATCVNHHYSK